MIYIGLVSLGKLQFNSTELSNEFQNWTNDKLKRYSEYKDCYIYWIDVTNQKLTEEIVQKHLAINTFANRYFDFWFTIDFDNLKKYNARIKNIREIFGSYRTKDAK